MTRTIPAFLFAAALFAGLFFSFARADETAHEALFYEHLQGKRVRCALCPRRCVINPGQRGFCGVRENRDGTLVTLVYGKPCSVHVDPIEKKPLFHVRPGTTAFSIATVGCNLRCLFCQNWQISQAAPEDVAGRTYDMTPEEVVAAAKKSGASAIAYTYTEPAIYYEYMFDIAVRARQAGLLNVMHSAGYINEEPLRQLCPYLDAANIDLKGFNERFYNEFSFGGLADVLRTLTILKEQGVWVEVTNLIIPGLNDDPAQIRRMCAWIRDNLGPGTPLHFSRFWPYYKLSHLSPTPVKTLEEARRIAMEEGLKYVYIGNIGGHPAEDTVCPKCGKVVVDRAGYIVKELHIEKGKCAFCGEKIEGRW
ncbi:MAG: AmmeMemoRadiSam system radical SAM enzyme [Deltaproteobacteria bacterium]